ncbi:MAG: hypothetical protein KGN76_17005 [Acidobacteriota bacterium]|nr:hypothetical protein [Acidobacteriota bacterium]
MSTHFRLLGAIVLLLGVASAGTARRLYLHPTQTVEQLIPGYRQANERQIGILYGQRVALLWDLADELSDPETEAVIGAVAGGLAALGCFYVAWRLEGTDPLDEES